MNTLTVPPVPEAPPVVEADERSSWAAVDLATVSDTVENATMLVRQDGKGLVYLGRLHWIQGPPESGKTWLALIAVKERLDAGENVAYIDFEDHPGSIKARLTAMGVPSEVLADPTRLAYIRPDEPLGDDQRCDLLDAINLTRPSLVVVDGVSEAMALQNLDPLSGSDVANWMKSLPKWLIAGTGAAVLVIDHQTKSTEGRRGWAIGSQHKKAGTDVAYDVEAVRPPRRSFGIEETEGVIVARVAKDRPGYVRGHCQGDIAATIRVTSWPDGGITTEVTTDQIAKDHGVRQLIAALLHGAPGSSKRALRDVSGKNDYIDQAVGGMIADGLVRVEKQGSALAHYLTEKGVDKYPVAGAET